MRKFLDGTGLGLLWNKIKSTFYTKSQLSNVVTHTTSSGIQPAAGYGSDIEAALDGVLGSDTMPIYQYGVLTQTQTWTQAADGGYDYTMSNLVYGYIPQANIDLFEAAGATFNSTTGYFELNGLTDISYEEMKAIYNSSLPFIERGGLELVFVSSTIRTNFTIHYANSYSDIPGNSSIGTQNLDSCGTSSSLEIFSFSTAVENYNYLNFFAITGIARFMRNNRYIKTIIGTIVVKSISSFLSAFGGCFSIENVKLHMLKANISFLQSPRLSLASVVYMVQNAANTSAITITLHATAYARCQADTTEYTYNNNTYTGIIALATVKNITIASA